MSPHACPGGESIVALAEGTLLPPESERVADHAADCPACFRALSVARAVAATPLPSKEFSLSPEDLRSLRSSSGGVPAGPLPSIRSRRRFPAWFPYAAAAGVALLVVAGGLQLAGRPPAVPSGEGAVRGSAGGLAIFRPASGAVLDQAPERIEWRAEGSGGKFRVRLLATATEEIWAAPTAERSIALPPQVRARLAPGGRFLVEVARMNGSTEPKEVEVVAFEVRAPR